MDDFPNEKQAYGTPGSAPRPGYGAADDPSYGYHPAGNAQAGELSVSDSQNAGSYGAPNGGYQTPGASYDAPNGSYQTSGASYGAPNGSYQTSGASYGAPDGSYQNSGASYGTPDGSYQNSGASYGAPNDNGYAPPYDREPPQPQSQAVSVVSLVFGILSVVCCWTFVLPFIFGTVAVICGIVGAVKRQKKVLWIIGIIAGVLGIVITVAMVVSLIPIFYTLVEEIERRGGEISPQDIQRILREYGIEVNIGAKLLMTKIF